MKLDVVRMQWEWCVWGETARQVTGEKAENKTRECYLKPVIDRRHSLAPLQLPAPTVIRAIKEFDQSLDTPAAQSSLDTKRKSLSSYHQQSTFAPPRSLLVTSRADSPYWSHLHHRVRGGHVSCPHRYQSSPPFLTSLLFQWKYPWLFVSFLLCTMPIKKCSIATPTAGAIVRLW